MDECYFYHFTDGLRLNGGHWELAGRNWHGWQSIGLSWQIPGSGQTGHGLNHRHFFICTAHGSGALNSTTTRMIELLELLGSSGRQMESHAVDRAIHTVAIMGGPMLDHVEIVLLHLAPLARHDLAVLHHEHVLARDRTKAFALAVIVDDKVVLLQIMGFLAQLALDRVEMTGKFEGRKASFLAKRQEFRSLDQFHLDLFLGVADFALGNPGWRRFPLVDDLILSETSLIAEVFELILIADGREETLSAGNVLLTVETHFETLLVLVQTRVRTKLLDFGAKSHAIFAQRAGLNVLSTFGTMTQALLMVT